MGFLQTIIEKVTGATGIDLDEVKENLKEQAETYIEEV